MTHDELLAKIEASDDNRNFYALRAVVELHKPTDLIFKMQFVDDDTIKYVCNGCGQPYPCNTIQFIEKELK